MNNWPEKNQKIKALVIAAHPDDETIWAGGTILTYPSWDWTIISLTWNLSDNPRGIQFENAIKFYKSLGVNIVDFRCLGNIDQHDLNEEEVADWTQDLKTLNLEPEIVLTHNSEGEYGHNHHKNVHKIVKGLYKNVWEFICPGCVNIAPQPFKETTQVIPLSADILNKKTELFNRCYTSELAIWKVMPEPMQYEFRTGPELFTHDEI